MRSFRQTVSAFGLGAPLMLAVVLALVSGNRSPAQSGIQAGTAANAPAPGVGVKPRTEAQSAGRKKRRLSAKSNETSTPVESRPPDPPPPAWPVNAKAEPASVGWDGRDLKISATNSSLEQILQDVSTATGVKVEGASNSPTDQRIYGSYGPAPARDVLSTLLEGSGYNVLMVGDQGEGTPRELVLTAKSHGAKNAAGQPGSGQVNQSSDEDSQEEPEAPDPPEPILRRPGGPGGIGGGPGQGRSPQQMMEEMQQRRQQMQEQQQQQQQIQQQNAQPPNNN